MDEPSNAHINDLYGQNLWQDLRDQNTFVLHKLLISKLRDANICIWDCTTHVMWQVQEHGYYQLKSKYWKEFDPLFAHFYPNELEDAQVCRFMISHIF
jgi:hypothetical protein